MAQKDSVNIKAQSCHFAQNLPAASVLSAISQGGPGFQGAPALSPCVTAPLQRPARLASPLQPLGSPLLRLKHTQPDPASEPCWILCPEMFLPLNICLTHLLQEAFLTSDLSSHPAAGVCGLPGESLPPSDPPHTPWVFRVCFLSLQKLDECRGLTCSVCCLQQHWMQGARMLELAL